MSTDATRYPGQVLRHGIDGWRPEAALVSDDCCPDPLCLPSCDVACSFVDLLPTGPLWDTPKALARERLIQGGDYDPCNPPCFEEEPCPTMVAYGIYAASVFLDMVSNIMWPAVRESRPETAIQNLDDWLDRLGWDDCYRSNCRTPYMAELSPYERPNACGATEYSPTNFSEDFERAMKHATVLSLVRVQRGVIRNIDGINWVIEPLGAAIRPRYSATAQRVRNGSCDDIERFEEPPCFCDEVEFEIYPIREELRAAPSLQTLCSDEEHPTVPARQTYTRDGHDPVEMYPALVSAECIVRSMMTKRCPNIFYRATT